MKVVKTRDTYAKDDEEYWRYRDTYFEADGILIKRIICFRTKEIKYKIKPPKTLLNVNIESRGDENLVIDVENIGMGMGCHITDIDKLIGELEKVKELYYTVLEIDKENEKLKKLPDWTKKALEEIGYGPDIS